VKEKFMRNVLIAIIASSTLLATGVEAQNASKFYGNAGYSLLDTKITNLGVVGVRLGYEFTPNFAIEGEAGFGITSKELDIIDVKVDNTFGGFLVGKLPVADKFELIGRIGYSHVKVSASGLGGSASTDDGSAAYGVGMQFLFDDKNGVRGDFTRYEENGSGFNGYTISYVRKF
jgi:outer membrane immunogenic protein